MDLAVIKKYTNLFLWDRKYPDLNTFFQQIKNDDLQAIGRFVQVLGLFSSESLFGPKIISLFPDYKKYIHPARAKGLELLWKRLTQN